MKIAITIETKDKFSQLSKVFGRTPYFYIVNIKEQKVQDVEFIENPYIEVKGGAGSSAVKLLAEKEVDIVISNNFGPRAKEALDQFKIKAYKSTEDLESTIKSFQRGELKEIK